MTDTQTADPLNLRHYGPTAGDGALRVQAEAVRADLDRQHQSWIARGTTRRKFIAGAGMVGVAALGAQYVTTRVAYAAPAQATGNTLIFVFFRGGCDGLRMLVPASDDLGGAYLRSVRGTITAPATTPLTGGWAMNSSLDTLLPLWKAGTLAFVPGVTSGDASRSHFTAQDYAECGGPPTTVRTGWLDRLLAVLGPGTTFRAVAEGGAAPRSLSGEQASLVLSGIDSFRFPGGGDLATRSEAAIASLYRGIDHPLTDDVNETLSALTKAEQVSAETKSAGDYGAGYFGSALADLARLVKAKVGMEVATVDVGGFDTHTDEARGLDGVLTGVGKAFAGFMDDLGPSAATTTVVAMTEFGRRVGSNGGGGTDHGHGSVMLLLGGGVKGGNVHGKWVPLLNDEVLDNGDVPPSNQAFDVLGEVVQKRLGAGSLATVFPDFAYQPIGVMN